MAARALRSPQVQALAAQLEARGWTRAVGTERVAACDRGQTVLLPFTRSESASMPPGPPPVEGWKPLLTEPPEAAYVRPEPEKPLLHRLGASGACIVYTAYSNGTEDAFAVINTVEGGHVLHLCPDGEQRWLLHDGLGILEQLRRNERYRKFEGWLRSGGLGRPADV
ncbi:MAG: hypothetical protein ABDI20_03495 [Candidatus Bipolaricaulaceae bacterium]